MFEFSTKFRHCIRGVLVGIWFISFTMADLVLVCAWKQ
jgi:hypothetical protein